MGKFQDLTGARFGRLVVIDRAADGAHKNVRWNCLCDCGKKVTIFRAALAAGSTKSCGCYQKNLMTKHGQSGKNRTTEYTSWLCMVKRCRDPTDKNYGNRGITVCVRWGDSFPNFLKDMGKKPWPESSIDRVNNSLGYSPENCRWASAKEQAHNRRDNHTLTFMKETLPLVVWAKRYGMVPETIAYRLKNLGWSVEKALATPVKPKDRYLEYEGVTLSLQEWAIKLGIPKSTLANRLRRGWAVERALQKVQTNVS